MGSTEDNLTVREVVLLMIDAAGGVIEGRTATQKLAYFGAEAIGQDLGHRAHYYGPYSREVENALSNSSFAGDLNESVRAFNSGRAYKYDLTEQGDDAVLGLKQSHPIAAARLGEVVERLGELVPGYSQHPLSLAAKVDLIIREQGGTLESKDIPRLAKDLGWRVEDSDATRALDVLVGLGKVTVE